MNVAIFGGTFDPVHRGHLVVARAARQAYDLARIYFVPADIQPFKQHQPVTPFYHRYAMLALATASDESFIPSLMEAPGEEARRTPSFTIDTVRRFRASLPKRDRLFFLIGIDSFLQIAAWREPEALLREVEFIVASRPGFSLDTVVKALPKSLRPQALVAGPVRRQPGKEDWVGSRLRLHLLSQIKEPVSATQVRSAAAAGRGLERLVGGAVASYIRKMHLYNSGPAAAVPRRRKVVNPRTQR